MASEAYLGIDRDDSLAEASKAAEYPENKTVAYYERVLRRVSRSRRAEDAKLRKLDALEGLRRFYSATGVVPDWWFSLREQVEAGEL